MALTDMMMNGADTGDADAQPRPQHQDLFINAPRPIHPRQR